MPSLLDGLSRPDRWSMRAYAEVSRAWERYAHRGDAPEWVRALGVADRVQRMPPGRAITDVRLRGGADLEAADISSAIGEALSEMGTRGAPKTYRDNAGGVGAATPNSLRQRQNTGVDPYRAREFSRTNEWTRAATNKLTGRVARAERSVGPLDPAKPYDETLRARIAWLVENPNPKMESWRSFIQPPVEDVIVLGKGGWEYVANWRGWPTALNYFDAAYMQVVPAWDGTSIAAPRYAYGMNPGTMVGLRNDECTLILLTPTTYRREGMGYVETLKNSIESDAAGNEFIRGMLKKYPPPGWLDLGPMATNKQVRSVAERLVSDILGTGGLLVTGGHKDAKFQSLWNGTSKDNELMAWSIYFARKIAAVFGISPQDFGITLDINKASSETQENMSMEDGYKAILLLVEEYVNREIVVRFGYPELINLVFRFKELTLKDRAKQARLVKDLMGDVPAVMVNEARRELDLPPLELGNAIYINTSTGLVPVIGEDAEAARERMASSAGTTDEEAAAGAEGEAAPKTAAGKDNKKKAASLVMRRYDPEGWRAPLEDQAVADLHVVLAEQRAEAGALVRDYLWLAASVRRTRDPDGVAHAGDVRDAYRLAGQMLARDPEAIGLWADELRTHAARAAYGYHVQTAGLDGELGPRPERLRSRALGKALSTRLGAVLVASAPAYAVTPEGAADVVRGVIDTWVQNTGWRVGRRILQEAARASLHAFLVRHPRLDGDFVVWQAGCGCQEDGAIVGRTAALSLVLDRSCGGTHDVVPLEYRGGHS